MPCVTDDGRGSVSGDPRGVDPVSTPVHVSYWILDHLLCFRSVKVHGICINQKKQKGKPPNLLLSYKLR